MEPPRCIRIAAEMLDLATHQLSGELKARLLGVEELVQRALDCEGEVGGLHSRQAVAVIVEQWEREKRESEQADSEKEKAEAGE